MGLYTPEPDTRDEEASLRCPRCAAALLPLSSRDRFLFLCEKGHEIDGELLLAQGSLSVLSGLEEVLRAWERRLESLEATAAEARSRGHHDAADIFKRQRDLAAARVDSLRAALHKTRA